MQVRTGAHVRVDAVAVRDEGGWRIDLPTLGTRTSARSLVCVQRCAEAAAADRLGHDPERVEVFVSYDMPGAGDAERSENVRALRVRGLTAAEVAIVLDVPIELVRQLSGEAAEPRRRYPRTPLMWRIPSGIR